MGYSKKFITDFVNILEQLNSKTIDSIAKQINSIRQNRGRIFVLGVGGSAANASHLTADLRKLCDVEAYCPTDNVAELTARTNDDGFETFFVQYLDRCRLSDLDGIFIMSVGGGDIDNNVSVGLCKAVDLAQQRKAKIFGITGKTDGYVQQSGGTVISIEQYNRSPNLITPFAEAIHGVIHHCIIMHPSLLVGKTKW